MVRARDALHDRDRRGGPVANGLGDGPEHNVAAVQLGCDAQLGELGALLLSQHVGLRSRERGAGRRRERQGLRLGLVAAKQAAGAAAACQHVH